jgi:membrane dipeptidase
MPILPFLKFGWQPAEGRAGLTLENLFVAQIDHICQLAGDARHVGIGTDFDGGFGLECSLEDVDTIADLQKLEGILAGCGYSNADVEAIMGMNWQRHLEENLPA